MVGCMSKVKKPDRICIGHSNGIALFVDPKLVKVSGPVFLDAGGGGTPGHEVKDFTPIAQGDGFVVFECEKLRP